MNINGHDIGVCSWSLQPQGMEDLVNKVKSLDLEHIQLGLLELVMLDDKRKYLELGHLQKSGLKITATMIFHAEADPIDAVQPLARHIRHVHIKDGTLSKQPGVIWGEEVPFGHGQVGPRRFLAALRDVNYTGPLVIEREAGNNRLADVE